MSSHASFLGRTRERRTMTNSMWTRIAAACGIVHVAVVLIGVALHNGSPDVGASAQDVARYASALPSTQAWIGNVVECAGYVLFLPFAAFLSMQFPPPAHPSRWLTVTALSAAGVYIAVSVSGVTLQEATVQWGKRGVDPQSVAALSDIADDIFFLSFLPASLFLAAVSALALGTGTLPRWLGASAALVAVILLVTGLSANLPATHGAAVIGFLLFALWIVLAAVVMIVRPQLVET